MNTKAKRKSVEWKLKKEIEVYEGDIEILEKLIKGEFKNYNGKSVNKWLEKRMKKATKEVYMEQDGYYMGKYFHIRSNKDYRFKTVDSWDRETSTINITVNCDEDNNFIYNEFEKQVKQSICKKKKHLVKLNEFDLDEIFEKYNKLYDEILKFKTDTNGLYDCFPGMVSFY